MEAMSTGLAWMLTITAKIKLDLYIYNLKNQGIYMFLPVHLLFYSAMVWKVVCWNIHK